MSAFEKWREELSRPCGCGREHPAPAMQYLQGGPEDAPRLCAPFVKDGGAVLVAGDENTLKAAGDAAQDALLKAGYQVKRLVIPGKRPHADMENIGFFTRAAEGTDLCLAVGSGTVCDIARYGSAQIGLPMVTLATALSMDGYASSVSPILEDGFKRTFDAKPTLGVLCCPEVLNSAPRHMAAAGVGDVAGKFIALLDWRLANLVEGEYLCQSTYDTIDRAAHMALASAPQIASAEGEAAQALMQALVLSGMMIARVGTSRPASGCEHMIAHFLEIRDVLLGREEALHGARVGVATLYMLKIYQRFFEKEREVRPGTREAVPMEALFGRAAPQVRKEAGDARYRPFEEQHAAVLAHWEEMKALSGRASEKAEEIRNALLMLGGPTTMAQMGYSREETLYSLLYAKDIRTRFGLLRLMDSWGVLREIAEDVLEEMYDQPV